MSTYITQCKQAPQPVKNYVQGQLNDTPKRIKIVNSDTSDNEILNQELTLLEQINEDEKHALDIKLTEAVVAGSLSHSFLANSAFKTFLASLNPFYKPPNRKIMSEKLVPELYQETEMVVNSEVRRANFVALSCDGWKDRRKRATVNVMVHCPSPLLYRSIDTGLNAHTGGVGFDINCGVRLIRTNLSEKCVQPYKEQLAQSLFDHIPIRVGLAGIIPINARMGTDWTLWKGYSWAKDKEHCEEYGRMLQDDATKVSVRAKKRGFPQLGTLGVGNHYGEVQVVDEIYDDYAANKMGIDHVGQVVVMIHCGSRGLPFSVFLLLASNERNWSVRGNIQTPLRNRMSTEIASMETYVKYNFKKCEEYKKERQIQSKLFMLNKMMLQPMMKTTTNSL